MIEDINYRMDPRGKNWTTGLISAGIMLWCLVTIGLTVFEMKTKDSEHQSITLRGERKNGPTIRFVRWFYGVLSGYCLVVLIMSTLSYCFTSPAPNFLDVCQPKNRELLHGLSCVEDVVVTCTTSAAEWMRARSSYHSTVCVLQTYLMYLTLYFVDTHASCKSVPWYLYLMLEVICNGLIKGTVISKVSFNKANLFSVILGCFFGFLAWMCTIMLLRDWLLCKPKDELPRYWNDVTQKTITPQTVRQPLDPLPSQSQTPTENNIPKIPDNQNHAAEDTSNAQQTNTGELASQPPSYQEAVLQQPASSPPA